MSGLDGETQQGKRPEDALAGRTGGHGGQNARSKGKTGVINDPLGQTTVPLVAITILP